MRSTHTFLTFFHRESGDPEVEPEREEEALQEAEAEGSEGEANSVDKESETQPDVESDLLPPPLPR